MPTVTFSIRSSWPRLILYGAMAGLFGGLLWYKLGTLVGGFSSVELVTFTQSTSLRFIFDHPLNAPFTLVAHGLLYIGGHNLIWMRVTAALFGLAFLATFYLLVRLWHGERTAIIGTVLFSMSAWFLHTVRLGEPDVLMFSLLALVTCGVLARQYPGKIMIIVSILLAGALLYVPGMVWFIGLGVVWQWKTISRLFAKNFWLAAAGGAILLAMVVPLGLAVYHTPSLIKDLIGLPTPWPDPLGILRGMAEVPVQLFIRGQLDPVHWLGRLPILDYFTTVMVVLGAYLYIRTFKLIRSNLLFGILILATALISLGGAVTISVVVPLMYVLAAAGIGLMIDRWYGVFPRNTIAQGIGMAVLGLAIAASCWYGVKQYFVAWPGDPTTRAVFTIPGKTTLKG